MKRMSLLYILVLSFPLQALWGQQSDVPEEAALKCLKEQLVKAAGPDEDALQLLDEYRMLLSIMDIEGFEEMQPRLDTLFTNCGYYTDGHFDPSPLIGCMANQLDLVKEKLDTSGSYYSLLMLLTEMYRNPKMTLEINPQIILGAMVNSINPDDLDKEFYQFSTFIVAQGVIRDFRNFAEKMENKPSPQTEVRDSPERDVETIEFKEVKDNVEVKEIEWEETKE